MKNASSTSPQDDAKSSGSSTEPPSASACRPQLHINQLPLLPFASLFTSLPLGDLLSAASVSTYWRLSARREASTSQRRHCLTLSIEGTLPEQTTTHYLQRSVWSLPHAEVLQTEEGTPLFPNHVPPSRGHTPWNSLLLATRKENPIQGDSNQPETATAHAQWQADYDRSFACILDEQVYQLLSLFEPPLGPRKLTIVCRSGHSDFLRLLPLLSGWKDSLRCLSLYSSHPKGNDSRGASGHYFASLISNHLNCPLLGILNRMPSLRQLTLDLVGEEGDTLFDGHHKFNASNGFYFPNVDKCVKAGCPITRNRFAFLSHLESFTFADRSSGDNIRPQLNHALFEYIYGSRALPLRFLQLGNSQQYPLPLSLSPHERRSPLWFPLRHLSLHIESKVRLVAPPADIRPSPFGGLTSLDLHLDMHSSHEECLTFLCTFLRPLLQLVHLRLHLTGAQVANWTELVERSLGGEARPPLPSLRVLSVHLLENAPIDRRLAALSQWLFPSLQVIVLHQRIVSHRMPLSAPLDTLYLAPIRRHFAGASFSSLRLLEGRVFLYQDGDRQILRKSQEQIWTADGLVGP